MNINSKSILAIQQVTRRFGGLVAVNEVSFDVQENEIFGVIGPNGAGKTTLFNTITGLISPTSGKALYDGKEITNRRPHQIAKFGIARTFQNIRLFGELSALENVAIARHLSTSTGVWNGILGLPPTANEEKQTYDRALELLELVGLSDRAEVKAKNFSYGDQRRLEIARALALQPKLLLLDEPAAGMNPNEKGQLSDFIRSLRDRFEL
ncbi:MAG: ABC transporter ATP-binding protein, partial [Pseudanabaena sp.]